MNDFSWGWNFREILAKWKVWQNVVIFWGKCVQSFRYWVNENVIKKYWGQYGDYVWGEICKNGIKNARDNCKSKNLILGLMTSWNMEVILPKIQQEKVEMILLILRFPLLSAMNFKTTSNKCWDFINKVVIKFEIKWSEWKHWI